MKWWPWLHPKLIGDWPSGPAMLGRRTALFKRPAAPLRAMIVVVDAVLLARARHDERVKYVLELLAQDPIQAHLYSYHGSPKHAQADVAVDTGVEGIRDWVLTRARDNGENLDAIYLKDGIPTRVPTQSNDRYFRQLFESLPSTQNPSDDLITRVRTDAFGLLVAKAIRADLYITDHPLLIESESGFCRGTTIMDPETALPVIGLYLRQQEQFVLGRAPALGMRSAPVQLDQRDRMWFFWEAAKLLLPARHRWAFGCRAHSGANDTARVSLPTSLIWRLDQVLRARDRLLATLALVPHDHSPADEAMTELDHILLGLMAAFDITARVAHHALGMPPEDVTQAGWQRKTRWLKEVAKRDEALADLMRHDSEGEHVLSIVSELRNTLHGQALSAGSRILGVGEYALQPLVELPQSSRERVLAAIEALGGRSVWGVVYPFSDTIPHLHPGTFVEQLLPRALLVINALMNATPVRGDVEPERIPRALPRTRQDHRIIWQLGLEQ